MNTTKKYQNTKDKIKSCSKFPVSDLRGHSRVEGQGLLVYLDRASMVPDAVLRRHYQWSGSHYGHKVPTAHSAGAHLGVVSVSVPGVVGGLGG